MDKESRREKLHAIVTRNGNTVRIPELLEDELDRLEEIFDTYSIQVRIDENTLWHERAIGIKSGSIAAISFKDRNSGLESGNNTYFMRQLTTKHNTSKE